MTDNEKKIIDKLIKDIKSLELAINSPTYPDTPHTRSSLIKLKGKLDILKRHPSLKIISKVKSPNSWLPNISFVYLPK